MLVVYKAIPSTKSWSFSIGVRCKTWREANKIRRQIANDASKAKDNSIPIVYDRYGAFIVEGWQKGVN
jgi:hypothetical protein